MSLEIESVVRRKVYNHTRLAAGGEIDEQAFKSANRLIEFINRELKRHYETGCFDTDYEVANNPNFLNVRTKEVA